MGLRSFSAIQVYGRHPMTVETWPGTKKRIDAHVGRIENRADSGNDGDVIAKYRKIVDAFIAGAQQCQRGGRRGGFKSDGEEHHVLFGIVLGQFQRVGGRVDDADVHAARFVLQRTAVRAGNSHHVAERGEDDIGLRGDGESVVNAAHRKHAHRAARTMHQLDVLGKQIL